LIFKQSLGNFPITSVIKYLPAILIVLFAGFVLFDRNQQDKNFENEIRKIDSARQALRKKVDSLNSKTRERDSVLGKILKRNLEIIDTLNVLQKTLAKNKQDIDKKIEASKEVIDDYWKNN
jgi:seryl-tRNA synthetase